jgi:hypothetical protein
MLTATFLQCLVVCGAIHMRHKNQKTFNADQTAINRALICIKEQFRILVDKHAAAFADRAGSGTTIWQIC